MWLFLAPVGIVDAKSNTATLERSLKHPSGAFHLKTPMDWQAENLDARPDVWQLSGGGCILRFFYRASESGFDSLHVACMQEFLTDPMDVNPRMKYEHDFVSGDRWDRRFLDSAFVVTYDKPVHGYREWRQWNLTVVGYGESLCSIVYCPSPAWKKSKQLRSVIDAVIDSIEFKGAR
ncbi:MAG: hypothetical protein JXO72_03165 [Vicinamibacteria bacterium]|nr:hypothetical protein [Vicinamibacteria bacterium]